jgi:hypothetical protein
MARKVAWFNDCRRRLPQEWSSLEAYRHNLTLKLRSNRARNARKPSPRSHESHNSRMSGASFQVLRHPARTVPSRGRVQQCDGWTMKSPLRRVGRDGIARMLRRPRWPEHELHRRDAEGNAKARCAQRNVATSVFTVSPWQVFLTFWQLRLEQHSHVLKRATRAPWARTQRADQDGPRAPYRPSPD